MRHIKLVLISFAFLFGVVTAISLLIPSSIRISRAVDINAGKEELMRQLADPTNWKNWYPGADSLSLLMVAGKPSGIIINPGKNTGLLITSVTDSSVLAETSGPATSRVIKTGWQFHPAHEGSTAVQWYMDFKLKWYPWEKFSSLLFEKQYGVMMETGLNKLKNYTENN